MVARPAAPFALGKPNGDDMNKLMLVAVACVATGAFAKEPVRNVSPKKHPNLAAAQKACDVAYEKLSAAQKANEYDLGGHAAKAKELLEQAAQEIKQAAEASNENKAETK